jgi:serpin B
MGPPGLFISKVLHGCFVDVNEEGTEAAGATAVIVARSLPPPPSCEFVADHPFFAAIVHEATGVLLFAGYVVDPTQE